MLRALLLTAAALLLALASVGVQRDGPDVAFYCEVGPPEDMTGCPGPRLNGGWPAPFLFDTMGVSVVRRLGVEDDFRLAPFAATFGFYLLALIGVAASVRRLRRGR